MEEGDGEILSITLPGIPSLDETFIGIERPKLTRVAKVAKFWAVNVKHAKHTNKHSPQMQEEVLNKDISAKTGFFGGSLFLLYVRVFHVPQLEAS